MISFFLARRRRENLNILPLYLALQARKFWLFTLCLQGIYIDLKRRRRENFGYLHGVYKEFILIL